MAKEEKIIESLKKCGLIAVVAIPNPDTAVNLCKALLDGGISAIEITFRNKNAPMALKNIKKADLPIVLGAGTVRSIEDAKIAIDSHVDFIVSPGLNEKLINFVKEHSDIPFYPGIDSTLGIEKAINLGINVLKCFPASVVGGIKWLKAMKGPYYDIQFMPTGGIGLNNLHEYLELSNVIACGGSFVAPSSLIKEEKWNEITEIAKKSVNIIKNIQNNY